METGTFIYNVKLVIQFTEKELELLSACCEAHYDGRVQNAAKQGGFIYGWNNCHRMNLNIGCKPYQLDLCAKALEQPIRGDESELESRDRLHLQAAIMNALNQLNEEQKKCNPKT